MNGLKRRYEYRETKRKMRYIFCIREWSKNTIRIQRDEEEDKIDVYSVYVNGLKRRYEHRETKRAEGVTHTNSLSTNTLL